MVRVKTIFLYILLFFLNAFPSLLNADSLECDSAQIPTYVLGDYQTGLQCLNLESSIGFFCQRLEIEEESAELIDDFHYFVRIEDDLYEFSDFQQYDDTFLIARKARIHLQPTMMTFRSNDMFGSIHREHMILMLTYRGTNENLPTIFGRCSIEEPTLMIDVLQRKLDDKKLDNQF